MENTEWKIAKSSHTCSTCQGKFSPSQAYYSALFAQDAAFTRQDYCLNCFQESRPGNVYYYWKTAVPDADAEKPKAVLDVPAVLDFFRRLAGDRDPQRQAFRYVLALMLTRKKALKLGGGSRGAEGEEVWIFIERRGGERHEVLQPNLDEAELVNVSRELGRLLGIDPTDRTDPADRTVQTESASLAASGTH